MTKVFSLGIQADVKNVISQRSPEGKLSTLYWLLVFVEDKEKINKIKIFSDAEGK